VAINNPAVFYLKDPSTEEKSASSESTVFKVVVVDVDDSVFQNLVGNNLH
jgi:hypothetical protein